MAYQSQFEYAQKLSRIKLDNYLCVIQRTLTNNNRYNNYCQIQETTGMATNQTDPALSLDATYNLFDGFNVQTDSQIVTNGLPANSSDIGGLRMVCNESGIYKIDVNIRFQNPGFLLNQALIRGVNGTGFQNAAPVLGNAADGLLVLHPRTSAIGQTTTISHCRLNTIARLNFGDFVQVSQASPNGAVGTSTFTINQMTIHLIKLNS